MTQKLKTLNELELRDALCVEGFAIAFISHKTNEVIQLSQPK